MIRTLRTTILAILSIMALLPNLVAAQQAQTETVTIQVNFTTPSGNAVIGTVVLNRTCGAEETTSNLSFDGMINGAPTTHHAQVIERWLGDGRHEIEVVSTDWQGTVLGRAMPSTITLVQTSPGLVTAAGVPAAIDGTMQPPCSGRTTYTLTNPGQGTVPITELPNTSGWSMVLHPLVIMGVLIGTGVVLMLGSRMLGSSRTKQSLDTELREN